MLLIIDQCEKAAIASRRKAEARRILVGWSCLSFVGKIKYFICM